MSKDLNIEIQELHYTEYLQLFSLPASLSAQNLRNYWSGIDVPW